jgi:hypothetical protein
MALRPKHCTAALILQAIHAGRLRVQRDGTDWPSQQHRLHAPPGARQFDPFALGSQAIADSALRPPRKYYKLTRSGKRRWKPRTNAIRFRQTNPSPEAKTPTPLHLAILRSASLLDARSDRAEWFAEWSAELWHVVATAFCLGAFRDAFWLRRNNQPDRAFNLPRRCPASYSSQPWRY